MSYDTRKADDPLIVVHPAFVNTTSDGPVRSAEGCLSEAVALAHAISGIAVKASAIVNIRAPKPATLFAKGGVEIIGEMVAEHDATVAFINTTLTPPQQRNLEKALKVKVIDRTGLILEIFGERARTREGTLQVELAALEYQKSRLVRSWTHLERQRGGAGFMGGPGESQIEIDRRIISDRITRLKKDLADVRRTRTLQRKARQKVPYPIVALVGYTNAGKSTLFNALSGAHVVARDQLFATLDPTLRRIKLPSRQEVILADTVGFISDLPIQLVAAFRATLEEVLEADILLHVMDGADPDFDSQEDDVLTVLEDLGVDETQTPILRVINKIDLMEDLPPAHGTKRLRHGLGVSALTGAGFDELLEDIQDVLHSNTRQITLTLPHTDSETLSWLYRHTTVEDRTDDEDGLHLTLRAPDATLGKLDALLREKE